MTDKLQQVREALVAGIYGLRDGQSSTYDFGIERAARFVAAYQIPESDQVRLARPPAPDGDVTNVGTQSVAQLIADLNSYAAFDERLKRLVRQVASTTVDLASRLAAAETKLSAYEALDAHLPDGYAIGDDATVPMAVRIGTLEAERDSLRTSLVDARKRAGRLDNDIGILLASIQFTEEATGEGPDDPLVGKIRADHEARAQPTDDGDEK